MQAFINNKRPKTDDPGHFVCPFTLEAGSVLSFKIGSDIYKFLKYLYIDPPTVLI